MGRVSSFRRSFMLIQRFERTLKEAGYSPFATWLIVKFFMFPIVIPDKLLDLVILVGRGPLWVYFHYIELLISTRWRKPSP
ncbi:membrane protein [Candidatus Thiomargarita nelsonii]|uniref:Membrane protein n=1 Tax=Candidatus Thiomargarita nelsonii TaxID=1003181 RepID=A0A176RTX9_9GAMM|nr:membrane protein [Candidatus Thiomargarita nelsonii]